MEAEENLELRITDIAHGGYGVARENGQVIFVGGAIPGEKVRVQIFERKRRFAKAVVQEVLEAAPERIENPWPAGGVAYTGAADFAHIALSMQRELKAQVVAAQLRKIGGEIITAQLADLPLVVEAVDSSDGWGSRSRIDLVKMPQGFGMYRAHSHELLPLKEMPLADARIESLDLWGEAWDKYVPVGVKVRAVASSGGDIRLAVGKKVYSAPGKRAAKIVREQVLLPEQQAQPQPQRIPAQAGQMQSQSQIQQAQAGQPDSSPQKNYRYALDAAGFWQVHREAPRTLIMAVQDFLGDISGVRGVDLYAGAGLFSQPLADCIGPRGSLFTYEGSREAVKAAQKNLAAFPWAKAQEVRIGARNIQKLTAQADFVLADPPRAGLGVAAAQQLAKSGAEKIVLVSCDPAAMARDVAQLAAGGYRMAGIRIFDIFPHTHHVETVCLLVLRNPVTHINIDVDVEELVQDKHGQATYDQIRDYIKEQTSLHVTNLNIAQTKRKFGIIERENYNLPKSEDFKQPNCTKEKEEAIKEAFKHFGLL